LRHHEEERALSQNEIKIGEANGKRNKGEGFLSINILNIRNILMIDKITKCAKHFRKR